MKKALLAAVFAAVASGAAWAGGGALAELKLKAPRSAESVGLPTPKAADDGVLRGLAKLQADTGVHGATPYEILKNLYESGVPATESDLIGWRTGRAVSAKKPDQFHGALIVGVRSLLSPDGGPLFQDATQFRILSKDNANNPYFYDVLTASMVEAIKAELPRGLAVSFKEGETPKTTISHADGGWSVTQYRKAGGYILENWANYDKNGSITSEFYSYFFQDVTPK